MRNFKLFTSLMGLLQVFGCQFPADPQQTFKRIKESHLMSVGICHQSEIQQKEQINLVKKLANHLDARIHWVVNHQENLYQQLENFKLDVVICDIKSNTPWSKKLGLTKPVRSLEVWALPPGENAWLKYVNDFIHQSTER